MSSIKRKIETNQLDNQYYDYLCPDNYLAMKLADIGCVDNRSKLAIVLL
jgi:hypothetical protein